jgi:hypothetical protein
MNSQGYGPFQASSPASEHPRQLPSSPTNVKLGITSNSKLTVSFDLPADIGGDAITKYKIEWDKSFTFNSLSALPDKGSAEVLASTEKSYTISPVAGLNPTTVYFVRVSAGNAVGFGTNQFSAPSSAIPANQIPGKPSTVSVATVTGTPGSLLVSWNYPRVPAHGIFCGGGGPSSTNPSACPSGMGSGTQADGGSAITKYMVQWDTNSFFNSSNAYPDKGSFDVTNLAGGEPFSYTITSLGGTSSYYYVRVYAYNSIGMSQPCGFQSLLCDGAELKAIPSG